MDSVLPQMVAYNNATFGCLPSVLSQNSLRAMMSEQPYAEIGVRLRAIRMAFSDMNQGEWAKKIGFNRTQYSNWENGQRRIPVDQAEKLCDLFGLTLDFVYRGRRDGLSDRAAKVL